jgi:tripartite-type tricarboxylate transporter receptor subunit TctC
MSAFGTKRTSSGVLATHNTALQQHVRIARSESEPMRRREILIFLGGAPMILPAAAGAADVFPSRPIRLIVPYPPGGGTDIVGRVLADKLRAILGQPIVIDNRGGAGGVLGTELAAKATPDGYTLLLVPTSHVINPSIYAKLPYDTVKDFAPITMAASTSILMAVNPRVPATTVRAFVEAAKADPKSLANYGSAGVGTVFHLTGQLFNELTGLALQHVPYRGGGPTITALLAGEVPLAFETTLSLQPHVRAGTLRALAITSPKRSATMPEIPATAEAGYPQLVTENAYALFAPAGTPAPILERLHEATVTALALSDLRDKLREQGADVVGNSSAELAAYVATEIPKWAALARQAGVKPE